MSERTGDQARNESRGTTPTKGKAWSAAIAEGLDMSLVELSLENTPWERLVEHDEALEFAETLRTLVQLTAIK